MKTATCSKVFATTKERRGNPFVKKLFCRGYTMVELLVASSVATLVTGTAMMLLIQSAKENRRGVADATVD